MQSFLRSLLLAAALPLAVQAQHTSTFVADVADAATGAPLRDADVVILDLHRVARTNWLGEATFTDVDSGAHEVRARKLGFVAAQLTLPFRGDTVGQVFMLAEAPRSLDTIRVTASNVPVYLQPFEHRMKSGLGRFLTEDQLDEEGTRDVRLVILTRFPGLVIRPDGSGHDALYSVRGFMTQMHVKPCAVSVYLDGVPITQDDVWDLTRTWDLAGVEYYDGQTAPAEYRVAGTVCGVLLLWSRWN
jgi:hypothetical protein